MTPIMSLPSEMQLHCFSFLSSTDILNLSEVCKAFNELSKKETLWKKASFSLISPLPHSKIYNLARDCAKINRCFETLSPPAITAIPKDAFSPTSVKKFMEESGTDGKKCMVFFENGHYFHVDLETKKVQIRGNISTRKIDWIFHDWAAEIFYSHEELNIHSFTNISNPPKHTSKIASCVPFVRFDTIVKFERLVISGGQSGKIHTWNTSLKWIGQLTTRQATLTCMATAHKYQRMDQSYLISGDAEGHLWIWNFYQKTIDQILSQEPLKIDKAHKSSITHLESGCKDTVISISTDGVAKVWDLHDLRCLAERSFAPLQITSIKSTYYDVLLGTDSGTLMVWDWITNQIKSKKVFYKSSISAIDIMKRPPILFIGYKDGQSQIFDFSQKKIKPIVSNTPSPSPLRTFYTKYLCRRPWIVIAFVIAGVFVSLFIWASKKRLEAHSATTQS